MERNVLHTKGIYSFCWTFIYFFDFNGKTHISKSVFTKYYSSVERLFHSRIKTNYVIFS